MKKILSNRRNVWAQATRFLQRLLTVLILFAFALENVADNLPNAVQAAAPAGPDQGIERQASQAEYLAANPGTVTVSASGIQPGLMEITAGDQVTFTNQDTRTRRIRLTVNALLTGLKVYLPILTRAGVVSQAGISPAAANANEEVISLSAGQSVKRTYSAPGSVDIVDADNPQISAQILVTPSPLAKQGSVTGRILDWKTKQPIAGAQVKALDTTFQADQRLPGGLPPEPACRRLHPGDVRQRLYLRQPLGDRTVFHPGRGRHGGAGAAGFQGGRHRRGRRHGD